MSVVATIDAVLLAGGQARRMGGGDKCLRELGGRTLLERIIERTRPQADAIALNANGDAGRFARFGLTVVADSVPGQPGPLAGVLSGLEWAVAHRPHTSHVLTVATDTPFFPADLAARLSQALDRAPAPWAIACAASGGRLHPVFGLWPVALAADLRSAIEDGVRRVDLWTARHGIAVAHFAASDGDPFFNINTEAELQSAAEHLESTTA